MRLLVDSNVLIRFLNSEEPDKTFLRQLLKRNEFYLSPINIAEVEAKTTEEQTEDLVELTSLGTTMLIDEELAWVAGRYRKQFSGKTKRVYLLDCFIAAACKVYNLILVTNDIKDYPMDDIKIIQPK